MKISYNWLKQFINLKKIDHKKFAHDMSLFGHEVESIKKIGDDYIFDFEITPNRGDCLSIIGIAREAAALYNLKLNLPQAKIAENKIDKKIQIDIKDHTICPRFSARIIDNIKIDKSPKFITDRLKSYGFRPLNNIVDITNYIMIETGQPLHAFDYDKISNHIANITLAKDYDSLITLDGKDNILDKNTIIIKDDQKIYDLAGIMGGFNSEVDENTKTILLQASVFNPVLIRKTSKRLNKITDASYRFERGVDIDGTIYALNRASVLIKQVCLQAVVGKINDKKEENKKTEFTISTKNINQLLGSRLSDIEIQKLLARLCIKFSLDTKKVLIPSYRRYDITLWQDIAEEVARIYGYNKLGISHFEKEETNINKEYVNKEALKDLLVKNGFTEIYSYSFVDEKLIKLLGLNINNCPKVINPIAPENKYLRPSLEPSLLEAVSKNPWAPEINIFEIGKVFDKDKEYYQLSILTTDKKAQNIKTILSQLNLESTIRTAPENVKNYLKIRKNVKYIILNLSDIKYESNSYKIDYANDIKYKPISSFAPTIRDLAFIVDNEFDAEKISNEIRSLDDKILLVELFDEFSSDKFGKNKKNIAYHIWLEDSKKPITSQKSDIIINKIIKHLKTKYKINLR